MEESHPLEGAAHRSGPAAGSVQTKAVGLVPGGLLGLGDRVPIPREAQ